MLKHLHKIRFLLKPYILLLVLMASKAGAQQYNFKNYSVENGLPYVQIFAMYQDSKGYLWSGGYGGLSKFNGKTFKNYSPKNGLANHYVNAIIEDQFHFITVGTIDGLSVIDKIDGQISNYYVKDGLPPITSPAFALIPGLAYGQGPTKVCVYGMEKKYFRSLSLKVTTLVACHIQKNTECLLAPTKAFIGKQHTCNRLNY